MVEEELRNAMSEVRRVLRHRKMKDEGLLLALDGLESALATPGREEARQIAEQPLPTGQIPSGYVPEFGE